MKRCPPNWRCFSLSRKTRRNPKQDRAKSLQEAQAALDKALAAIASPGLQYPSLRASLKAPEGPAETDESRRRAYPQTSTGRRRALAMWLTDRANPLTARVAVNHIWLRHFGQPLVESVSDFGLRSPQPVQQQLLDWLAVEFMEHGWSMKHLHQLILTSDAWRRSSAAGRADPATLATDSLNAHYWRRLPTRMESQVLRDSLMHLAGELDLTVGGPPLDANGPARRRSLYLKHSRDDRNQFLELFDDADILLCYRRSESIVPQQALALANSELSLSMARRIAQHLGESPRSDEAFVRAAFQTILCFDPSQEELAACLQALQQMRQLAEGDDASSEATTQARANLVHALLNHNDFITIR